MKTKKQLIYFLLVAFFVLLFSKASYAAVNDIFPMSALNSFNITLSNPNPFPYENISASIENPNFDVSRSYVKWLVNGIVIREGKNETNVSFSAGKIGSSNGLTAIITLANGAQIKKTANFIPADLDLLWSADTYTPYFYKGKALASPSSSVTVAAIPQFIASGEKLKQQNLYFKWYFNSDLQQEGWGKDSFSFKTTVFSEEQFAVRAVVESENKKIIQDKTILIENKTPEINFYEYDDLYGVLFQKSLSKIDISSGNQKRFIAEPLFAPSDIMSELTYNWTLNNKEMKNEKPPFNQLNFSSAPGARGEARFNLKIKYFGLLTELMNNLIINIK